MQMNESYLRQREWAISPAVTRHRARVLSRAPTGDQGLPGVRPPGRTGRRGASTP